MHVVFGPGVSHLFITIFNPLSTLLKVNDWEKIMSVLPVFPLATPAVVLKGAVITALQKPEWIEMVTEVLGVTPAENLCELGSDVSFISTVVLHIYIFCYLSETLKLMLSENAHCLHIYQTLEQRGKAFIWKWRRKFISTFNCRLYSITDAQQNN